MVTVYVFAATQSEADRWARDHRYRRRDVRTFGNRSDPRGLVFRPGDRVVIVGVIGTPAYDAVTRIHQKSPADDRPRLEWFSYPREHLRPHLSPPRTPSTTTTSGTRPGRLDPGT